MNRDVSKDGGGRITPALEESGSFRELAAADPLFPLERARPAPASPHGARKCLHKILIGLHKSWVVRKGWGCFCM